MIEARSLDSYQKIAGKIAISQLEQLSKNIKGAKIVHVIQQRRVGESLKFLTG